MAGFFDPTDPTAGGMMTGFAPSQGMPGVMGMLANPQTAGLLGMAGGLLQSAGPSRLPVTNGMAMGAGLQGMQQGIGNAIQNQRGMMLMRALGNAMGPSDSTGQPAPQAQPMPAVTGGANAGPMSGLMAGMGNAAPTPQAAASSAQGAYPAADPQSVLAQYYQKLNAYALAGLPTTGIETEMKYDPRLAYSMPTPDMVNAAAAFGQGTPEAQNMLRGILTKNASMTARAGGYVIGPQGVMWMPNVEQGGMPVIQNGVPTGAVTAQPGATDVASSMAAAKAGGKAQYELQQVWDPSANGGQGGFVQQTTANVANAANGGNAPIGIQNNNFGNIRSSDGKGFASYQSPQEGVNAADGLLATYGSKYGINTISGIANRWAPAGDGNNNPAAKAAAMAAASGVPANQPINLADPATRARILPALFDTETPGWRNALNGAPAGGAPAARGAPMAAQPPLGTVPATNTAQNAASTQMADMQGHLADSDNSYQASRAALQKMIGITQAGGIGDAMTRLLPSDVATRISNDAAEYQKAHANFVSLQGKALGAGGTDTSRGTIDESVPTFDKPSDARLSGLNDQLNQLDWNHLKRQTLNPTFNQGDQKAYTTQSAAFDSAIQPQMMPQIMQLLNMPAGAARGQALQAAVQNPQMKAALDIISGQFK